MTKLFFFPKVFVYLCVVLMGAASASAATIKVSSDAEQVGVNYNTIQAAYDYIKGVGAITPIAEAYTIEIQGTYAGEAAYPINLTAIAGASEVNTITIKPASGAKITIAVPNQTIIAPGMSFETTTTSVVLPSVAGLSTTSYVSGLGTFTSSSAYKQIATIDEGTKTVTVPAGTFTSAKTGVTLFFGPAQTQAVNFNGASYVTIDGVSRTDATIGLTIANPNCIYAQTIYFMGAAQYNTVKNCIIRGANQTASWQSGVNGTVYFAGSSFNTVTQNDVCDMDSVTIPMPIAAFQMTGTGNNFENTVSYNNIYNISNFVATNGNPGFFQFGSTNNTGSYNNAVLNNKMYWTKITKISGTNLVGVGVGGNMNGLGNRLEGNTIGYANADGTGISELDATGATVKFFTGLKNFTCKNNKVANIEMSGNNLSGFEFGISNASTPSADDVCSGNTVENIKLMTTAAGTLQAFVVNYSNPYDANIKNNIVRNMTIESKTGDNTLNIYGFQTTGTYVVGKVYKYIGNEVSNLTCGLGTVPSTKSGNVYGIKVNIADLLEKNLVYNLNANAQAYIRAVRIEGNNPNPIVFQNNVVRIGTDVTGNANIIAIQCNSTSAINMYHNTIYVGGECAADAPATVVTRIISWFTNSPTLTMQNNIFSNKRFGGLSLNSILLSSAGKVTVSHHNLYEYNGEFAKDAVAYVDFAAWAFAMPTLEAVSLDNVNPLFVDATAVVPNMHLPANSPANKSGMLISSVTDDFEGALRAEITPADLGAYAIAESTAVEVVSKNLLSVFAANNSIVFDNLAGYTAKVYSATGQLVKSVLITSEKMDLAVEKGCYIISVANQNTKVLVK